MVLMLKFFRQQGGVTAVLAVYGVSGSKHYIVWLRMAKLKKQ